MLLLKKSKSHSKFDFVLFRLNGNPSKIESNKEQVHLEVIHFFDCGTAKVIAQDDL
jgi:hypothetical protein